MYPHLPDLPTEPPYNPLEDVSTDDLKERLAHLESHLEDLAESGHTSTPSALSRTYWALKHELESRMHSARHVRSAQR